MNESPNFPPQEIGAFLRFCAGEWMALNSAFELAESTGQPPEKNTDADDNSWHSSERGELVVTYLEPARAGEPGGLSQGPKDGLAQQLIFENQGNYRCGNQQGRWQLWPDGSLELVLEGENSSGGGGERRERIWFTKPNLRLRSCVQTASDGSPSQAEFSSEIRRVSKN